jgi:hypothetical protein
MKTVLERKKKNLGNMVEKSGAVGLEMVYLVGGVDLSLSGEVDPGLCLVLDSQLCFEKVD